MVVLRSRLFLIIFSSIFVCFSASASTLGTGYVEKTHPSIERTNSVRVRCFIGGNKFKLSVASVLETRLPHGNSNKLDIALTTGHGLVNDDGKVFETCYVYGPKGRKLKVKAIKLAPDYRQATGSDWAVLIFDRIKAKDLIRYNVDPTLSGLEFEKLARAQADVKFSQARGILQNKQNCNLQPRQHANLTNNRYAGIIPHSCKAIGGQSGSPVTIAGVKNDIVIGIHLGKSFSLPVQDITTRAQWFGFMRIIDNSFLEQLEAIVTEMEHSY